MTDPTAADIAAMLERYPRDDFYTWVHRREPRRTVRELVRVAAGECIYPFRNCESFTYPKEAGRPCSPCTARAWIAEQRAKGCESAAFLGPEVPCGTCVPCLLKELPDA